MVQQIESSQAMIPDSSFSEEQMEVIHRLARRIVQLKLGMVALLFIESVRPLNFVGSQLLHFLSPIVHTFGSFSDYHQLATLLEDRRSIYIFMEAIEKEEASSE